MDKPCSPTWQAFTPTRPLAWQQNLNTAKSPSTASPPPEANRCFRPNSFWTDLDRTRLPSKHRSCLKTPICWPSTNLAGCPPSPAAASWKTPCCAWCKGKPPTPTLSTGWAEPLPASSSSPKHRRRPLNYWQTGTHPEFKKSTTRRKTTQPLTYEILTPIGLVPHPLIGSVWAANPSGKPSKSLAKVISRTTSTTTFEVRLNSGRPHQIRIHLASIGHPLVGNLRRLNRPTS